MKTFSGWIHAVMKKARITKNRDCIQRKKSAMIKKGVCTFICIHLHTDTPVQYL